MRFTALPPVAFALGVLALAGVLYLLQRLRVRHARVPVVTTLFWHEAVEEARARELVQRFRHLPAYLFVLAIASLVWLITCGPEGSGRPAADRAFLFDAGAYAAADGRFEAARQQLLSDVEAADPRDRSVLWCGAEVVTLLAPGEPWPVLVERLSGLEPDAAPSSVERAVLALDEWRDPERALEITLYGDASPSADALARLDPGVTVARAEVPTPLDVAAIVALGCAPAASGRWGEVDIRAEVTRGTPEVTLDGRAFQLEFTRSGNVLVWSSVPARGGRLELRVEGGLEAWQRATLMLPDRPPLGVALADDISESLRLALSADSALKLGVDVAGAEVVVRTAGDPFGAALPALEVAPSSEQHEAVLVSESSDVEPELALRAAVGELGLDRVDADALATRLGRPLEVGLRAADVRGVSLWGELLDPAATNFAATRSLPVLVSRAVRWLAGSEDFPREVAAGRTLTRASGTRTSGIRTSGTRTSGTRTSGIWRSAPGAASLDSLGGAFALPAAGDWFDEDGRTISASLIDPTPFRVVEVEAGDAPADAGFTLGTWILLLILALLALEWRAVRSGQMP